MVSDKQVEAALSVWYGVDASAVKRSTALRDMWGDMRAALLAAERAAWEDISTAPRDGSPVWLQMPAGDEPKWESIGWHNSGGWVALDASGARCVEPKRWRPLPAAQEASDAE